MAFGINTTGFNRKRIEDIRDEIKSSLRGTFGNSVNLDERAPLGQLLGIFSERESLIWQLFEDIYNNLNPTGAEGVSLDNVVSLTGSVRKSATKSTGTLTLFGTVATVIPADRIVSVAGNPAAKFLTSASATIAAGVDEIQTITFSQVPDAGSFTLNFDGEVTAAILSSDNAAAVDTKLEALVNLDSVTVTGSFTAGFIITFTSSNGSTPQPLLIVGANSLTTNEITSITTVADVAGSLDGKYFRINDEDGSVGVWIDVDNNGTSIPGGAAALSRSIEVTGVVTGDSATLVATAVSSAINADAKYVATSVGAVVTITDADQGARTDAIDGNSGFSFAVTKQGQEVLGVTISPVETLSGALPQVNVAVSAQTAGATPAPAGGLTVIETPVTGWSSATNALDIVIGADTETDALLKTRRLSELAVAGRATVNAILAKILAIADVTNAIVFENQTNVTDPDGRPPNSVEVVVQGGTNAAVAAALFDVVAAGIESYGTELEAVEDSQGFEHNVGFSRPTAIPVHIEIDIVDDPNLFPADGAVQIENAIVAAGDALGIGTDVIVTPRLICSIDTVPGILSAVVRLSTIALPVSGSSAFTAVNSSGTMNLLHVTHGRSVGDRVKFSTSGTLPSGLNSTSVFTIVTVPNANNFQVAADRVSAALPFVSAGSGVHTYLFGGYDANIVIRSQEIADFDTSTTLINVL